MAIAVRRSFGLSAGELASASRAALDVAIAHEAELWLARPSEDAVVLGAFQRDTAARESPVVQRGTGGPEVRIGAGTLYVALLLPRVNALVACDESHLVNRYVRPILRALTRCGALAHYFGRDWISVAHRPAAWVGFAHDRTSGRAVVEAFLARATPFHVDAQRESYMGKEPGTLASITGKELDEARLADAIVTAYAEAYGRAAVDRGSLSPPPDFGGRPGGGPLGRPEGGPHDLPWLSTVAEIIGPISAGPDAQGTLRVGGDLLVSRDALAALEAALPSTADDDVAALVDATFRAPHVALDGVRSLASVRDVILAARRAGR